MISYIIVGIIVGFVIFLILREYICWYFKINQIVTLLDSINKKLMNSNKDITTFNDDIKCYTIITEQDKENGFYICTNCGRKNPIGNIKCIDCQTPKKE